MTKCEECGKEFPLSLLQDLEDMRFCFKCYDAITSDEKEIEQ